MKDRIIIALDTDSFDVARKLVDRLSDAITFKVGLQAFLKFGDRIIDYLKTKNKKIFLDLKFKDIPNTVYGAMHSCLKYSPYMTTIHLSGGQEMIRQALEAARQDPDLTVLGVTILTSLSDKDLEETGINLSTEKSVLKLAGLGIRNGIKGLVCSPLEVESIRDEFGHEVTLVTPGIRPSWSIKGDQKRIFSPRTAIEKGSDYLVIGRPVTKNEDPASAFQKILDEIQQ
jgi:orotidine-5'-phosphate decarboxylase